MKSQLAESLEMATLPERDLYQRYDIKEEIERITYHYEQQPEFFKIITGGEWHTYSSPIWEDGMTLTQAQEKKLDEFARMMNLKPGMHILDVGCGWGGPLVYLCKTYGVTGHGITISPMAIPAAEARAKKYGVDATFEVVHWSNLKSVEQYDAVYSDEALVHFNDLSGFFNKAYSLLKPGGRMVNKELHFNHSKHKHAHDGLSQHINKVFGYTGNYIALQDELSTLDECKFSLQEIRDIPIDQYKKTITEHWLKHINQHKDELAAMTSRKHVMDIKIYLRGICYIFAADVFGMHIVAAKKQ